jgi:hypothetical protein
MQLNQLSDAELLFNNIPSESIYKNKSLYYLSLCYVFNHKEKEGLELLNATSFKDSVFMKRKNKLLNAFDHQ